MENKNLIGWGVGTAFFIFGICFIIHYYPVLFTDNGDDTKGKDTVNTNSTTNIENQPEDPLIQSETTFISWSTSPQWPYGKWTGGTKNGKPHGDNVTVIYLTNCVYNPQDPLKRVSTPGQKVVGYFEDGNLIIGDIYDENDNLIERNFEPKL